MGTNVTQKTHAKGTLKVKPGDTVQLRTIPPVGTPGSKPAKVTVTLDSGPSHSLKVKASANGRSATVRLVSSGPGNVSLLQARYACHVPPLATFCPFKHVSTHGTQTSIELAPRTAPPVIITAMVGPVSGIVKPRAQRKTTVVSPYAVSQMARTVIRPSKAKHASKPASVPFSPSTTAKPGNLVVLRTHLEGTAGAPQPVTIVIDQGSGHELKASASVLGGKPAVTTIKSGSKKPIVLMVPTYVCFLPPFLTVCPAVKATTKNHKYTLKFMATPRTPAIVIVRIHAG